MNAASDVSIDVVRITPRTRILDFYRRLGERHAISRETLSRMLHIGYPTLDETLGHLVDDRVLERSKFFPDQYRPVVGFDYAVPASFADWKVRRDERKKAKDAKREMWIAQRAAEAAKAIALRIAKKAACAERAAKEREERKAARAARAAEKRAAREEKIAAYHAGQAEDAEVRRADKAFRLVAAIQRGEHLAVENRVELEAMATRIYERGLPHLRVLELRAEQRIADMAEITKAREVRRRARDQMADQAEARWNVREVKRAAIVAKPVEPVEVKVAVKPTTVIVVAKSAGKPPATVPAAKKPETTYDPWAILRARANAKPPLLPGGMTQDTVKMMRARA